MQCCFKTSRQKLLRLLSNGIYLLSCMFLLYGNCTLFSIQIYIVTHSFLYPQPTYVIMQELRLIRLEESPFSMFRGVTPIPRILCFFFPFYCQSRFVLSAPIVCLCSCNGWHILQTIWVHIRLSPSSLITTQSVWFFQ